ncbi:MAG: alpha/beta hydrolase [Planctomycetota bacterium]
MRRTHALVLCALLAAPAAAQRNRSSFDPDSVPLQNFSFSQRSFHSDAVDGDVEYGIYLPKGYEDEQNADTRYPLIVWLHGMFEDDLRFHGRGGAPVLDTAVGDGTLPPCIFVCPNGGRTSMWVNRHDRKYEDLVTVDLLDHLQRTYRVSQRRDQRAIMGVSMGGMAALRIAFTQPELFGAVAVHSSAILPEDPDQLPERMKAASKRFGLEEVFGDPIEREPWQRANPLCLAHHLKLPKLRGLRIYFDAGTEDRYQFHRSNALLHKVLDDAGIDHTWRLIEGGGHSWGAGFQDETLPHSFAMVGEMFRSAAAKKDGLGGLQDAFGGDAGADGKGDKDDDGGR